MRRISKVCIAVSLGLSWNMAEAAVSYKAELFGQTGGSSGTVGYCSSLGSVVDCWQSYSNTGGLPPLPGYAPGQFNIVGLTAQASSGPASSASSATASFTVLGSGDTLFRAYASGDGGRTVREEVPLPGGGIAISQASTDAWSRVTLSVQDSILFSIPDTYGGLDVYATYHLPFDALGNGASSAVLGINAGGWGSSGQKYLTFGNPTYSDLPWSTSDPQDFTFLLRSAGDSRTTFDVPINIVATFSSAPSFGWGSGFVDAEHSVGLKIIVPTGVAFRSASGELDALLSPIPEPAAWQMLAIGACMMGVWCRRRPRRE